MSIFCLSKMLYSDLFTTTQLLELQYSPISKEYAFDITDKD